MIHNLQEFGKLDMKDIDFGSLNEMSTSAKDEFARQFHKSREDAILHHVARIAKEYPDATECYFVEFTKDLAFHIEFLACENGLWLLPEGMTAPVEVKRVDLTAYKKLVESGVIKNNTVK